MTEQNYPINPPPELVKKWSNLPLSTQEIITIAWRNGADAELEACCEWLDVPNNRSDRGDGWLMLGRLRAARRPKPPSLKEQALEELDCIQTHDSEGRPLGVDVSILRRALESIPDPSQ
jgi:hypothetical protein